MSDEEKEGKEKEGEKKEQQETVPQPKGELCVSDEGSYDLTEQNRDWNHHGKQQ